MVRVQGMKFIPSFSANSVQMVGKGIFASKILCTVGERAGKLLNGGQFMINLMKSADPSKHLINTQGQVDMVKVREYLKAKRRFLRKLMTGNHSKSLNAFFAHLSRCIFHRQTAIQRA